MMMPKKENILTPKVKIDGKLVPLSGLTEEELLKLAERTRKKAKKEEYRRLAKSVEMMKKKPTA